MAVPSTIADLSTTLASNSPAGSESVFTNLDDYLRAHAQFIAQLYTYVRGPAFSAYRSTAQTLPSGGSGSKFQGTSEEFDTANCYDSATNYRFTPNVAGYYQFNAGISWTLAASAGKQTSIILYKNGSAFKNGSASDSNVSDYAINSLSALVYMNGSTDYAELFIYQNTGSNLDTVGGATTCYFQGFLARIA